MTLYEQTKAFIKEVTDGALNFAKEKNKEKKEKRCYRRCSY